MKIAARIIALSIAILAAIVMWRQFGPAPDLQEGDLVFQTSRNSQSAAILVATRSAYTHMGIVEKRGGDWYVVEANGPVQSTPLKRWTARGYMGRYSVFRHRNLSQTHAEKVIKAAHRYEGRAYDLWFSFDNREIYCSELPWLAFQALGLKIGQVQRVEDLHINGKRARTVIEKRWRGHPLCQGASSFEICYARIRKAELITPISIAADKTMRKVYTNYLF